MLPRPLVGLGPSIRANVRPILPIKRRAFPILLPGPSLVASRAFSLWPSQSHATPSSLPIETIPSPPPPPRPPTMSELSMPSSLPDPTLWEPLSTLLVSLPATLHLTWPLFIPLLTLLIRSSSMVPLQLWQRRQMRRFATVIRPRLKGVHERLALGLRDSSRRKGLSYEQYEQEYKKAVSRLSLCNAIFPADPMDFFSFFLPQSKEATHQMYRSYGFHPRLTMYIGPLVNIPLFIFISLILRDACQRALLVLPFSPAHLPLPSSATLTPEILSNLQDLATSSFLWCPSLCLPDSTMFVPLMVGLATLLNTEVSAKMRRAVMRAGKEVDRIEDGRIAGNAVLGVRVGQVGALGTRGLTAAEKRRVTVINSRREGNDRTRGLTTQVRTTNGPKEQVQEVVDGEDEEEPRNSRIITNAMRCASVAFIPIAAMAPVAVCLYWLTSNCLTLLTNLTFAYYDRTRERKERLDKILRR
ncbi:BZ3500_MvSof-1268-A1-R1_Chr10-3g03082 [Microbotryum saponariae]|uniref:BZ3500_MvSof-1268-A1-R1_Chr10-3g03082 protein n=1 Tax=Microbotryum saponariae TaxID=289078 RepID=A0A2X0LZK6_9BASI|nr:BZ3501_MvSof-1269-A2-R1_Chr10-2g02660 [Microbotryum saponariae]SDA02115.1 BZ3500_MvSof-1268-A1-R1_Chr10-3g03082 [Microbotryum saponariae]